MLAVAEEAGGVSVVIWFKRHSSTSRGLPLEINFILFLQQIYEGKKAKIVIVITFAYRTLPLHN